MALVALCTTTSAPRLSGRCSSGVASVLSTTHSRPRSRAQAREVGESEQWVRRRFEPEHVGSVACRDHRLRVGDVDPTRLRPAEFLQLVYANDAKLYVPVSNLHLIGRYSGAPKQKRGEGYRRVF